ncbi:MAG: response regulator [Candidatus Edwardsbacteria bacterium]|jgi:CheY-like chemotaxis protein|nr:response regulator [Candidatus Edwardsbacteria bacterium]
MTDGTHHILWVDDEIELLRSQIMFLEAKGFTVATAASGEEAVAAVRQRPFDLVLLDEMMPGMDGLAALGELRRLRPELPAIMATKSEKEELVGEALGLRIDDFLLKPLNPAQVLASCRRVLDGRALAEDQTVRQYAAAAAEFRSFDYGALDWRGWIDHYRALLRWEMTLSGLRDDGMHASHEATIQEANLEFGRFVEQQYPGWLHGSQRPVLSVDVVDRYLGPAVRAKRPCLFVILDCMRLDQWLSIEPLLRETFDIAVDHYYSILPTATPYARNAIFSGLFPAQIARNSPQLWERSDVPSETSRNRHEHQLFSQQLARLKLQPSPEARYVKVYNIDEGREFRRAFPSLSQVPLVALVVNFMDILVHFRAESQVLQEIAPDVRAFRELTRTWFSNSDVWHVMRTAAAQGRTVVVTTDHGSIRGRRAAVMKAGKDTSANLRYKSGSNISGDHRQTVWVKAPADYQLPEEYKGQQYLIAKEDFYLVYPTRVEEYRRRYEGTFQHGGISMEEMILPVAVMTPK